MDILDRLPDDLKWNVQKYLRHPIAELFDECVEYDCTCEYLIVFGNSYLNGRFDDGSINYYPDIETVILKKIYIGRADVFTNMPDDSDDESIASSLFDSDSD